MMKRSGILFTGKKSNIIFAGKTKFLLLCASIFLSQSLSAKSTVCYKKDWSKPSSIESIALDGGECTGKFSLYQMQNKGWFIEDIKIKTTKSGLNYTYVLTDIDPINIKKWKMEKKNKNKIINLNLNQSTLLIRNISNNTAIIDIGNLKIGQSGIINHTYEDGNKLIVSSAFVIESNENSSKIKFLPFLDLKQNALPTSNRKPINGDELVLNYLYDYSLLIAPNNESFKTIRNKYKNSTFLHSDLFAAFLKIIYQPLPSKEMIKDFALAQNMGTIFIVIESNVYILDSRTFAVLDKVGIPNYNSDKQMPFYTRVENIETSILTTDVSKWYELAKKYADDLIGDDKRTENEILHRDYESSSKGSEKEIDYTEYYKKLLGV